MGTRGLLVRFFGGIAVGVAAVAVVVGCAASAVMIGDTPWDIEAARKTGVETICLITGGFSEQELRDAGAVGVYESVEALRDDLDNTPLS